MAGGVHMLSGGTVFAGDVLIQHGHLVKAIAGQVSRTDTVAKSIGYLPAGSTIIRVAYMGLTNSNAGTTAILDAGFAGGTGKELVSDENMKSVGTGFHPEDTCTQLGVVQAAAKTVTAKYAETGTASTTGGPWLVLVEFLTAASAGF